MIGGYIYRDRDPELEARLEARLDESWSRIDAWGQGYLFHDAPSADALACQVVSRDLLVLSQDLLVGNLARGEYVPFEVDPSFGDRLARDTATALDAISSDFRMIVVSRASGHTVLTLVSCRAGAGRIYHHSTGKGVVFASDLRFLLGVVGCDVSPLGIYAILKYGAVPEPLTVSTTARAVPVGHFLRHDVDSGVERHLPYLRLSFPSDGETAVDDDGVALLAPVERALRRSSSFLRRFGPAILLSGGIDSSLYGYYLGRDGAAPAPGFYCAFGDDDPELDYARQIADRIGSELHVARMGRADALGALAEATRLSDHPFSDFSSLPVTFLLRFARDRLGDGAMLIECNGGDDCFGFPDLASEKKFALKHRVPGWLKRVGAAALRPLGHWKWESSATSVSRLSALVDVHQRSPLDYFYVLTPVNFLGFQRTRGWDDALDAVFEHVYANCSESYETLGWAAKITVRQLLQVNSRRWAAKALSVGESLGLRVVYPYLWREVLIEQGRLPWEAKLRDGVVKWPLKRLLEAQMPASFVYREKSGFVPPFGSWLTHEDFNAGIREILLDRDATVSRIVPARRLERLLDDARGGRRLRHSVLNLLWGALFTEMWLREHGAASPLAS